MQGGPARRTTLGALNPSAINARRSSLENGNLGMSKPPRPSMGTALSGGAALATRRVSLSNSGGARRSSSTPRGSSLSTSTRTADPRSVTDKSFIASSVRTLLEFLAANNYEHPINSKVLYKPCNKDYYNLVLFLFKLIDPNYVCIGKIEEEIITMFKFLGYPYAINKSNIAAVGSPHAWPHMLASIMWLVELLSYDKALQEHNNAQAYALNANTEILDEDNASMEKSFYKYLHTSYYYFMNNKDSQFTHIEEQFVESFNHKTSLLSDAVDSYNQKNNAINNEITMIKQRSQHLPELNNRKGEGLRQIHVLTELVSNKQKEIKEIEHKISLKTMELDSLQQNINGIKKEIHKCKDILSKQEISANDVINMNNERMRLEAQYQQVSEQRQAAAKEILTLEIQLKDSIVYLENAVCRYHNIAEELKLIPLNNKNARGENYYIEIDIKAKRRENVLKTDIKNYLVMLLNNCKQELLEMTLELRQTLLTEQETAEEYEIQLQQLLELQTNYSDKVAFLEDIYNKEKQNFDTSYAYYQKEIYDLEHKLIGLRDISAEEGRITSLNRRINELNSVKMTLKQEFINKKNMYMEDIINVINMCATYREEVTSALDSLKLSYGEKLQTLMQQELVQKIRDDCRAIMQSSSSPTLPMPVVFTLPPAPPAPPTPSNSAFALAPHSFLAKEKESLRRDTLHNDAVNDSVRFDDNEADDDLKNMSVLSSADQSALHAMMHGL